MIDESTMYWITRLDKLCSVMSGLAIAFGIVGGFSTVVFVISYGMTASGDGDCKITAKVFKWLTAFTIPLFFLFLLGWAFVPTTKEYAAIKLIPAIVNNQEVRAEAKDAYELMKEWLKDRVEAELPPEKDKKR
jgi:H+/Cl- antiporter ClcA